MAFFIYSFITEDGKIVKDRGYYESVEDLYNHIESNGNSIYKIVNLPSFFVSAYNYISIGKAKLKDISEFIRNLSNYLEGGLSIQDAIVDLGDSSDSKSLKYASKNILSMLNEGYSLSKAFLKTYIFPDVVISMAKIGETSGNLDKTLKDAADYLDRNIETRSAAKRALIYPAFSLFAILGAFIFWIIYILPKITELFISQGIKLPLATKVLIFVSNFIQNYWLLIISVLAAAIASVPFMLKIDKIKLLFHKLLWKLPVIGLIVRYSQTAFYFQYLSLLTSSGITITEALNTMQFAISNKFFLKSISGIVEKLKDGESLSKAVKEASMFEPIAIRMISVGEQTGNLDIQMKKLSEMYYNKVQNMVEVIGKLIEPIILIVIGILFVFFVLALIGPIYDMLGSMTK